MGTGTMHIPQHSANVLIDGCHYQINLRIALGNAAEVPVPVHSHSQFELFAFPDGTVTMQVGNEPEISIYGGECYLLCPHCYHRRSAGTNMTKYWSMFIRCSKDSPLWKHDYCLSLKCAQVLLGYFARLEQELSGRRVGSDSNIQALLTLILVAILRELDDQCHPITQPVKALLRYDDLIDDYIALHYSEDLRIDDLAQQAGITSRHLARIMQRRYGCTFRQRLLEIRMYHAQKFLRETDLPINRIAIRCGFTAEGAFSTAFRRTVGYTPSQYRRLFPK